MSLSQDFNRLHGMALELMINPRYFFEHEDTTIDFEDHVDCDHKNCNSAGKIERIYQNPAFPEAEVVVELSPDHPEPGHLVVRLIEHNCCPRIILPALKGKFWRRLAEGKPKSKK